MKPMGQACHPGAHQILVDGFGEEGGEWSHDPAELDQHLIDGGIGGQLVRVVLLDPGAGPDQLDVPAGEVLQNEFGYGADDAVQL